MDRNALMGPFQQGYAGNVVERGNIVPAGTYEDGVTRWAWPGIIDAPWEAWKRFALSSGEDVKAGAEVATNALMGGMVSPKPANALGMFGGLADWSSLDGMKGGGRLRRFTNNKGQEVLELPDPLHDPYPSGGLAPKQGPFITDDPLSSPYRLVKRRDSSGEWVWPFTEEEESLQRLYGSRSSPDLYVGGIPIFPNSESD